MPHLYTPLLPFPMYTWIAVFLALVVGAICLCIVSVGAMKTSELMQGKEEPHDLVDAVFMVLKMNLFQNVRIKTNLWSKTVMMGTLLSSSLIIGNLYTGKKNASETLEDSSIIIFFYFKGGLSRVMTLSPYESPVDSVERLVQTDLLWGETSVTW